MTLRASRQSCLTMLFGVVTATVPCTSCRDAHSVVRNRAGTHEQPVRGGTLRIVANSDVDHLSTISGYGEPTWVLSQLFARQLVAYPPDSSYERATSVVPDLAREIPTRENGGISADGKTYVFHLRPNVRWNSTPPRAVTALDVGRAFKLLCNPVSPVGARDYYANTIVGMASHCEAFALVPATVEGIRQFVAEREIPGVRVLDSLTLEFRLVAPATDFLNILALPFVSAIPEEYLNYLPDSPESRQHTLSDGPYAIASYKRDRGFEFVRNPVWDAASDPTRPAYVDRISVQLGVDATLQQLRIEAGTADLSLENMLTPDAASLRAHGDRRVHGLPAGEHVDGLEYLVVNVVGHRNGGALRQLAVRQAIALAVDKEAQAKLTGGPGLSRPMSQGVMSGSAGYRAGAERYRTPGDRGAVDSARRLLASTPHAHGLQLRLAYWIEATKPLQAQSIQENLRRVGIDVQPVPYRFDDFMGRLIVDTLNAALGVWDIALIGWVPDWFGSASGRAFIPGTYDSRTFGHGAQDFGGYSDARVSAAIERALSAPSVAVAESAWAEATDRAIADVAIVPLVERKYAFMLSSRVRGCVWAPLGHTCSLAALWLRTSGVAPTAGKP